MPWTNVPTYVVAQVTGAFVSVASANLMCGEPLFAASMLAAQLLGAVAATAPFKWLVPGLPKTAPDMVLPMQEM